MANQYEAKNYAGTRFGRLVVLSRVERAGHERLWLCKCDCGTEKKLAAANLISGRTRSCGCLKKATDGKASVTHGLSKHRVYAVWNVMIQRCHNPKNRQFIDYGARGISVCLRWRRSFANFVEDIGLPGPGMTLERSNNSRGYSKSNCVWATRKVQNRNTRRNRLFTFRGKSQLLGDWAEELGIKFSTLASRLYLYGWSVKKAFTTAVRF